MDLYIPRESKEKTERLATATSKSLTLIPDTRLQAEVVTVDRAEKKRELLNKITKVFDNVNSKYGLNPSLSRQHLSVEEVGNGPIYYVRKRSISCHAVNGGGFTVHG